MQRNVQSFVLAVLVAICFVPLASAQNPEEEILTLMGALNANLEAAGANYRIEIAEYVTAFDEMGQTVLFNNVGNKQLGADFVPGDPRRAEADRGP